MSANIMHLRCESRDCSIHRTLFNYRHKHELSSSDKCHGSALLVISLRPSALALG